MRKIGPSPLYNTSLCICKQFPRVPSVFLLKIEHPQVSQPFLRGPIFKSLHHFLLLSFETSGKYVYVFKSALSQMEHGTPPKGYHILKKIQTIPVPAFGKTIVKPLQGNL